MYPELLIPLLKESVCCINTSKTGPSSKNQTVCPPCTAELPDTEQRLRFSNSQAPHTERAWTGKVRPRFCSHTKCRCPIPIIQVHIYYKDVYLYNRNLCTCKQGCQQPNTSSSQPFCSSLTPDPTCEQAGKTEGPLVGRSQFQSPEIVFIWRESKHTMPLRSKASSTRKENFSADARGIKVRWRNRKRLPSARNKCHSHVEESWWEIYSIWKFSLEFSRY